MNYRLTLQYDGTDFHGWQMQDQQRTVQGELTRALSQIDGQPVIVHGAGRTDAGVHAEAQVANVHLRREMTPERLRAAVNGNINRDLRVAQVENVPDDFHARFAAIGKTYRYHIYQAPFISPFRVRYALHEARPIHFEQMKKATYLFIGTHDWTAFCSTHTEARSRVRTVTALEIFEKVIDDGHAGLIEIRISADGFLRYMVRSIVGTLLAVGRGEIDESVIKRALENKDRSLAGATAAPQGLTLLKVHYPPEN